MDSLITLLREAAGASVQPRSDSLALAVAARAAHGRKWLEKAAKALPRIQVRALCPVGVHKKIHSNYICSQFTLPVLIGSLAINHQY